MALLQRLAFAVLAPLIAVWVAITNPIPQIGGFLGGGDLLGLHLQSLGQRAIAAAAAVIGEQVRGRSELEAGDELAGGHGSFSSTASIFSKLMLS